MPRPFLLLLACLLLPCRTEAQTKTIPEDARRGYVEHVVEYLVRVDGREMRLAPGATIRNTDNLIIVPGAMPRAGASAGYVLDASGQIVRLWLLTAEEAALAKPARALPGNP